MLNIFKMDIRRLLHSKVFYISIAFITVMAVALVMSGMCTDLGSMLGATGSGSTINMGGELADMGGSYAADAAAGNDFLGASMGTSVIFILISIILTLFICGDYSGGFARNIFSAHSDPKDYIGGKMLSMAVVSAGMIAFYTILSMIALLIGGHGVVLEGGILGLITFIVQKWLVSCAISALIILINLKTRNSAVGIIGGFLIATGGLTMGLVMFGEMLGLSWMSSISNAMISGVSQKISMTFSAGTFFHVLIVCAVWLIACTFLSRRTLLKKDV